MKKEKLIKQLKLIHDEADFGLNGDFITDPEMDYTERFSIIEDTFNKIKEMCKEVLPEEEKTKAIKVNCTITYWGENSNINKNNIAELLTESLSHEYPIPANLQIDSVKEVELTPIDDDGNYF